VTVSHLIPIAVGYELVPAHIAADPVGQATLAATADTFAAIALVTTAAGNFLGWGVVIPLYAVPFSPCSIPGSCRWPPSVRTLELRGRSASRCRCRELGRRKASPGSDDKGVVASRAVLARPL
jgi:hypothetical protein